MENAHLVYDYDCKAKLALRNQFTLWKILTKNISGFSRKFFQYNPTKMASNNIIISNKFLNENCVEIFDNNNLP